MRLIDIEAPCKIEIELYGEKCHATVTANTVDAVPVVRCKDCNKREVCRAANIWATPPVDDWYCADGERKPYTFDEAWENLKNESEESRKFFEEAERIAEELKRERKDDEQV